MKILGLFVNTITVDSMYSPHNWEKFPQRLQTQLSKKGKVISEIFIALFKSIWIFVYLEKKDQLHNLNISEVIDPEKCSDLNAKKQLFQNTFHQWTCSWVPNTALKSSWQHFDPNFPLIQDKLSSKTCL